VCSLMHRGLVRNRTIDGIRSLRAKKMAYGSENCVSWELKKPRHATWSRFPKGNCWVSARRMPIFCLFSLFLNFSFFVFFLSEILQKKRNFLPFSEEHKKERILKNSPRRRKTKILYKKVG